MRSSPTLALVALTAIFAAQTLAAQNTINVPGGQPTIQGAINVANNGDTVMVAPGTYYENINFNGKAITITSSGGAAQTIIDGGGTAPVVSFSTGEGANSVLKGFTIQNGAAAFYGGGISINSASPTITNNVIQNNTATGGGGGIGISNGAPLVQSNTVQNNSQLNGLGGIGGGGIGVNVGSPRIIGNTITHNSWPSGSGGGISLFGAGNSVISKNVITGNSVQGSTQSQGGGLYILGPNALVTQNLIYSNVTVYTGVGSEVSVYSGQGSQGPALVNNTILATVGGNQATAVYVSGFEANDLFSNNVVVGLTGQAAVTCDSSNSQVPPTFANNDIFTPNGAALVGSCAGQNGQNGNVSLDPLFINPAVSDFHLQTASPAIDAGTNSAPNLPQTDFAGTPRILDGNNDCVSTVDMGAYELARTANASISPTSLSFPSQILNTTSAAKTVTLSNTGATCFQFSSLGTSGDYAQNNACLAAGLRAGNSCVFSVAFDPTALGKRLGALNISGGDGTTSSNFSASLAGIGVDFGVAVNPISASVHHGTPVSLSVSVTPLGGRFSSSVALSCSGMPSFSSCTFSPASVTPGEQVATSTLTIAVGDRAALGNFNILVKGTSGPDVHSTNLLLAIF